MTLSNRGSVIEILKLMTNLLIVIYTSFIIQNQLLFTMYDMVRKVMAVNQEVGSLSILAAKSKD